MLQKNKNNQLTSVKAFPVRTPKHENSQFIWNRPIKPINAGYEGDIGIEIELEGIDLPTNVGGSRGVFSWRVERDGSLRNGGLEYVLSRPIKIENTEKALKWLYNVIEKNRSIVQLSTRCSTHVHINMTGQKINHLCSFVVLWGIFEELFVNWCGDFRVGNNFCVRMKDSAHLISLWEKSIAVGNLAYHFSTDDRYGALNGDAFNKFGSFEIRTLEGCTDYKRVLNWALCMHRLKELANSRFENPEEILRAISGNGAYHFFRECFEGLDILPELEEEADKDQHIIGNFIMEGLRRVQHIVYTHNWEEVMPLINDNSLPNPFKRNKKKVNKAYIRAR